MPLQTSYGYSFGTQLKGQAERGGFSQDITGYSASATEFGMALVYAGAVSDDNLKVALPSAPAQTFVGVSKLVQLEQTGAADFLTTVTSTQVNNYLATQPITIRNLGRIYVYTEVAVEPSDAVYYRYIAKGALPVGNFLKTADAASITNKALTSNVATLTSANHGFAVGQVVTVAGMVDTVFNGTFTLTAVTTNTFSYAKTNADIASASVSAGTVDRAAIISNARWVSKRSNAGIALLELY